MRAEITTVSGERLTMSGPIVQTLQDYFDLPDGTRAGLGWVRAGNTAVNFHNVETVTFKEGE